MKKTNPKSSGKLYDLAQMQNHPKREIIEKRLKIIEFFDKYGKQATKEAFGVSRSRDIGQKELVI